MTPERPPHEARRDEQGDGAATILVVDDGDDVREYLTRLLARRWRVRAVADAESALAIAHDEAPDLIVSDVMMPGLSGFELVARLRADPATRALPVVLLTARADEESTVEGLEAGADDYLVKPFSARELMARVHTHLELSRQRAELAREQAARAAAERMNRRLKNLQAVSDTALSGLELDDLMRVLLDRVGEIVAADAAAILLMEADGSITVRAATGLVEAEGAGVRIPPGHSSLDLVAAAGRPLALDGAAMITPLPRKPVEELLGVPLFVQGRVIGELQVGRSEPRPFSGEEVQLMQLAAERIALALEQARLVERERRIAETLQRSMLPERLPQIPGIAVAARYCPAAAEGNMSGDWYEVIALGDGRLAMAIGDVAGHGIRAAALMGQLRNVLRAYALEGGPPSEVVGRLDAVLQSLGETRMVTLLYSVLDPRDWSLRLASAGHLPPLVLAPDGTISFIDVGRSAPLGVWARAHGEAEVQLEPGSTLVLYTDGLVERRGHSLDEGLDRLARIAGRGAADAEVLCQTIFDELLDGDADDDSALLVARVMPLAKRLELPVAAAPEALAALRQTLRRWLDGVGASRSDAADILLACGEAASNAVEHAYGPGEAKFELTAALAEGEVVLTIRDRGRWRPPRGANRGRGKALMETLMDSVRIDAVPEGTTVVMRKQLNGKDGRHGPALPTDG